MTFIELLFWGLVIAACGLYIGWELRPEYDKYKREQKARKANWG